MTAGDSRAELTINRQPALAPSPQPRPAPTARALPSEPVARGGQNWTPIEGQSWKPIDTFQRRRFRATSGRSCSAANRVFFKANARVAHGAPDRAVARHNAAFAEFGDQR